jgi:hypothetical protein
MLVLSTEEAQVCNTNPIDGRLDGFRKAFRAKFDINDSDGFRSVVDSVMTNNGEPIYHVYYVADGLQVALNLIRKLFVILVSLPAASLLQSRQSTEPIVDSLALCISQVSSGQLNVNATALLLERVTQQAPDHDIWCAVYNLFSPSTPVDTSAPPFQPHVPRSIVLDTPLTFRAGLVHNMDDGREYMDTLIKNEMEDHIYLDVPGFFPAFFDSVDGLQGLVDDAFARCQQINCYMNTNRWSEFPQSCEENQIAMWFQDEVGRIVESALHVDADNVHAQALTSRCVVFTGSTALRKLDVGFAALNKAGGGVPNYDWEDILVPGKLKENDSDDTTPSTWYDLGRHVREVYYSQDTRRFCHGFTLCGEVMRVWRHDRGAICTAPPFNVSEDGRRFVTMVLGYYLMRDDELGFDPSIVRGGKERYIPVVRDGVEERFFIENAMYREACILVRATTCWKAMGQDNTISFVIKDSWQYDGKDDEGGLLMDVTNADVPNVASCYHYTSVLVGD